MKNTKKLFLIFLLIFGFLVLSAGIADASIISGLGDVGWVSAPAVFEIGGQWYLISGKDDGRFVGYSWDGTRWNSDASIIAGLGQLDPPSGAFSKPTVFNMGGILYLIAGENWSKDFYGFRRVGASWQVDNTITAGLNTVAEGMPTPTVFNMGGGNWHLITGKGDGTFDGYRRVGANWVVDTIDSGLFNFGICPALTVFNMGGAYYLIAGRSSMNFFGFRWNGTNWISNLFIETGLTIGGNGTPDVFVMGTDIYLISGEDQGTFRGWKWNGSSWVGEIDDSIPPIITDLELIDQGDGDTYRGGITTFASLGNISINVEAMDNTGGSGVQDITIYWNDGSQHSHGCSFVSGTINATCSYTINLSAHSGDTIKYWAKATDYGTPPNTIYSPDWGNPGTDGWYIKVKADITCPLPFFQYKHIPDSLVCQSPGAPAKLNHTFIFPAKSDDKYYITKMQSRIQSPDASNWRWLYSYKINNGANINVDGNLESGAGNFTRTWTGDFSTAKNEKLKVKFSYGAFPGGAKRASNMLIEGSCGSCVANGGACPGGDADCCSGHCQNGICCANGHTCCTNHGHCPSDNSCANACQKNDNYCDTATDHYCKTKITNCPIAEACSAGICAAGNNCNTGVCRDTVGWNHICEMKCDGTGAAPGACTYFGVCLNHCINVDAFGNPMQDCDETGPNCGDPEGDCPACAPLCAWQDDGCGAHGCVATTHRGESCQPAGCLGGPCADGATQCVPDATCAPLCAWQDDGCGAHGCNPSTERGEFCGPAGCSGGECNPAITPTKCVPDATCAPLCFWQDDGCGAHGCNPSTHRGESCQPAGCSGGECNPAITPTKCVGDPNCDCDSSPNFCETGAICPGFACNGHTCWDIGAGESSVNTCCGDSGDPGETYVYRGDEGGNSCDNTTNEYCVFGGDDTSDEACCNPSSDPGFFKCAYNGVCYEHLATIDLGGTCPGAYCYDNKNWIDCDVNIGTCNNCIAGAFVAGGELAQFGEYDTGSEIECCGDDANEFLATQGPGIAAHGSKCCNSALNHGLVGDTGSCIECIANGASDGGNPTWCCSNYSQGGICCKSGTCCADDSACGSNSCSDNCHYAHPYCDTGSGDYNCKSSNKSCSAGNHCVGGATPCAPATEICGNDDDEDCDGIALPCCYWQDDGCGKHDCDIWTQRGEICMPDQCTGGDNCFGQPPRCVADDLCSTFGLPDRTIMEILLDVVDWLLGIIAALAFLMIVIGGVVYLSSSGDVTRIETAKKIVTYAIVGLIIAGVSYTVIHVVFDVLQ